MYGIKLVSNSGGVEPVQTSAVKESTVSSQAMIAIPAEDYKSLIDFVR